MMVQQSRFNLKRLAIALQIIPIVVMGFHAISWLADVSVPNINTAALLLASAIVSVVYMRETIRVLNSIKLDGSEQAIHRVQIILANTKLALLLNLVGFLFLLI